MQKEIKYAQVTEIKKTNANTVFDLQVEEDESYNINGLTVHNSGASSLVAYLLGIHRINPLDKRWGEMPFERFLSMGKLSNKIIIFDDKGNKKEFVSQDLIKIKRDKNIIDIEAKDLQEGDEFLEVVKRFSI